jgi:hypothetical protein
MTILSMRWTAEGLPAYGVPGWLIFTVILIGGLPTFARAVLSFLRELDDYRRRRGR